MDSSAKSHCQAKEAFLDSQGVLELDDVLSFLMSKHSQGVLGEDDHSARWKIGIRWILESCHLSESVNWSQMDSLNLVISQKDVNIS